MDNNQKCAQVRITHGGLNPSINQRAHSRHLHCMSSRIQKSSKKNSTIDVDDGPPMCNTKKPNLLDADTTPDAKRLRDVHHGAGLLHLHAQLSHAHHRT